MAYKIEVPVDWMRYKRTVYIIEDEQITGNPPAVYPNIVDGFFPGGFLHHYAGGNTPQYYEYFDEIGKTVFSSKEEAEKTLAKMNMRVTDA